MIMKKYILLVSLALVVVFSVGAKDLKVNLSNGKLTGAQFTTMAEGLSPETYDSLVLACVERGDVPSFMSRFKRIDTQISTPQGVVKAYYYVAPDYLCIGTDQDFIRIPMQPKTAQRIANKYNCFLSTRKISDDVYRAAKVKLAPMPMMCEREKFNTFVLHNYIIEGQRKGAQGLIAGHKKDVIITTAIPQNPKADRVALYGWHRLDGRAIQPIYTGHVDWYIDYSHGFRLVHRDIWVDGLKMDYRDVMADPVLMKILVDEDNADFTAYPTKE